MAATRADVPAEVEVFPLVATGPDDWNVDASGDSVWLNGNSFSVVASAPDSRRF